MAIDRTKLIFSIGFTFGVIVVGTINYVTFENPSWYRELNGMLSAHAPSYSGFPFAMYIHAYLFSAFLPGGLVGNLLFCAVVSSAFGWIATKIPGRKTRLK